MFKWMFHNFCQVSSDFPALLRRLQDPLQLRASEVVIQFPFVTPVAEEKTEEELARIAERKKEQGKKLQEMAANKRMEKVCYLCRLRRVQRIDGSLSSSYKKRTTYST